MKKILKIVTLVLTVCLMATFMFGCNSAPDTKEAKKNLKNEDYNVTVVDDEKEIKDLVLLSSCTPKELTNNLEDADYEVMLIDDEDELEMDGAIVAVSGRNEDGEFVNAYFFEDMLDAIDGEDYLNEVLADMIEEINDAISEAMANDEDYSSYEDILEDYENIQIKRFGKWVVAGNKDGISAMKLGGVSAKGAISYMFAEDDKNTLEAVLFEDKSDAKDMEEKLIEALEDVKDVDSSYKKHQVERIGNWVVVGTEDAIEAFKG